MTRAPWAWAAAAGVTLAAGAGCYSPPQYGSPYGGYPAYQAAPAYPAAPGGSYVVPGGSLGAPTTIPGTGAGPTLAPPAGGGGGGAPAFNPTYAPGGSGATPAGPSVPNYEEPRSGDFDSSGGFGPNPGGGTSQPPEDGFKPPATNGANTGSPFMEGTAAPRRLGIEQAARPIGRGENLAGLDQYGRSGVRSGTSGVAAVDPQVRPAAFSERLVPVDDFGFDPSSSPEKSTTEAAGDEGFGHDRSGYRWLRGVVDYDPDQRNWNIIYGLPPDPDDAYGGSLTLADDATLRDLRNNDVVLVEGQVEPAGRDVLGKPLYRVTKAELIGRYE